MTTGTFEGLIRSLDSDPLRRGKQFEKITKWWLQNDPIHSRDVKKVWLWDEWPDRPGRDIGVDLVAEMRDGSLCAIQSKCFDVGRDIPKSELDSFVSAASTRTFKHRWLVASTDGLSANARRMLRDNHVTQILFSYLDSLECFWPASFDALGGTPTLVKASPRAHQLDGIRDVVEGLSKVSRGQLIMACGTGKTLTALWITEALEPSTTLVLVPSLSLLSQTLSEWAKNANTKWDYLCVCSDETVNKSDDAPISTTDDLPFDVTTKPAGIAAFLERRGRKIIFSTYQSSAQVAKAQKTAGKKFDLVICDEAHRLTGKNDAEFATALDETKIPAKKRLFMTATPRTYTASVKAKASERGVEITSMDDETVFGTVLHKLSFGEAIHQGLLSDYRVVIVGVSNPQVHEIIKRRELVSVAGTMTTDARTLAAHVGLAKATRDFQLKRTISFHGRIKSAREFAEQHAALINWMPRDHRPQGSLWAGTITGSMNSSEKHQLLTKFKAEIPGQHALLSNARCLTEGIDVPSLDGVAFIDPRTSQVDIVQAVGRAIRKNNDKSLGTIVLPLFIQENEGLENALADSSFSTIWSVINALRAHDEVLANDLDTIRFNLGRSNSLSNLSEKIVFDIPAAIEEVVPGFIHALKLKLVERSSSSWEYGFGALTSYVEEHRNARVPQDHVHQGINLGHWVGHQRLLYRDDRLDQRKIQLLESMPEWTWNEVEQWWKEAFQALKEFATQNGHVNVPPRLRGGGVNLRSWITRQRVVFQQKELSLERKALLETLPDWNWSPEEDRWNENFRIALEYCRAHPDDILKKELQVAGKKIGMWAQRQRARYKDGSLEEHRIRKLESIPQWTWDATKKSQFDFYFKYLRNFCNKNKHSRVPQSYVVDEVKLGGFVARCRQRPHLLTEEQRQSLESLPGWTWKARDTRWSEMFELLSEYSKERDPNEIRQDEVFRNRPLGTWVFVQKSWFRGGRLEPERAKQLETIRGWSWERKRKYPK